MPPRDRIATSVVPPPISTTMEPVGSVTGRPAPIAAAIGSSIRNTRRAPALSALSWIARRSTAVEPEGTQMIIRGLAKPRRGCTRRMKCLIISSATSKSAITPSRNGRIASMLPGVRPTICLASSPTARTWRRPRLVAMRHHRRLVQDDARALDVDQRVGGAEIDRHVRGEQAEQSREHLAGVRSRPCSQTTETGGADDRPAAAISDAGTAIRRPRHRPRPHASGRMRCGRVLLALGQELVERRT